MTTWAKGVDFKNSSNTRRIGGVGVYGNGTTAEKLYMGLGEEPWNNKGLQLTNNEINFKGNKIYHAGDKPTLKELGAAEVNHTHNYLPLSGGTMTGNIILRLGANALSGTGITTGNTQVIGTAAEMIYFGNPKTKIKLESIANPEIHVNGSNYIMYHTGNKPSYSDIGAAASNHTHNNYLPLSGGTVTGAMSSSLTTSTHLEGNKGTAIINSTAAGNGYTMLAKMNSTNGVWTMGGWTDSFNLFYTANSVVSAGNNNTTKRLILLNEAGNSSFPGTVTANSFSGNLTGNANTATTLQTTRTINGTNFNGSTSITTEHWGKARNIQIGNASRSVNGSSDVTWSLNDIGAAASSHNHTTLSSVTRIGGAGASSAWGSIDISGSKQSWAGIHFSDMGYVFLVNNAGYSGVWKNGGNAVFSFNENGSLVAGNVGWDKITGKPSTYTPSSHTHDYLPLSGGSRLVVGTATSTSSTDAQIEITAPNSGIPRLTFHSSGRSKMSLGATSADILQFTTERSGTYRITNANGYVDIGTQNTTYAHYNTDRPSHWFNTTVRVNGEIYAGSNYNQRVYHTGYKPSYSDVGAASASHTHSNYAPISHNHTSLTGVNSIAFSSHETDAVSMGVLVDGTKSYMDFNLADDLDDMWRWRFKASGSSIFNAMTLQALSGTTSKLTVSGEVAASTFSGSLSGNATTATKLQNAKTIKIGNTSRNFDGSSNVSWSLGDIGATTGVVANALVQRDVNSDISVRLVKSTYMDQSTVTGALAFRVNNNSDNYVRFCSNPTAINNWLGLGSVPTHAPLITNLNSQLQSGWYSINTSTSGRPSGVDYGVVLQMRWYNGADFYQILVSSNNARLYTRGYINGGYTSWNEK